MANVNLIAYPFVLPVARPLGQTALISVSPSENPIAWIFKTATLAASDGYARALIQFLGATTAGNTITINGTVYEATNDPTIGEFLPAASAFAAAEAFKQAIEDDPSINWAYNVSQISNLVYITAKLPGSRYDLATASSGGFIYTPAPVAGIDRYRSQAFDDFSVYAEIWGNLVGTAFGPQSKADAQLIRRLDQPANREDRYVFDVSPVVRNLVEATVPLIGVATFSIQTSAVEAYFLKYGEQYRTPNGTGLTRRQIGETGAAFVVNCALHLLDQPRLNEYGDGSASAYLSFLSEKPDRKLSRKDSFEWLYLLHLPQASTTRYLSVAYNITFVDGTNSGWKFTKTATSKPGVLYWRVDYASLGLQAATTAAGKEALRWTVQIIEHSNPTPTYPSTPGSKTDRIVSKETSFVLSENCEPEPLLLCWLNSLGGWETFSFDGLQDKGAEIKKTTYERSSPIDFVSGSRRDAKVRAVTSSEVYEVWTFRSELLDEDHHEFLKGLFASPSVYLIENYSFRYVSEISGKWQRKGADSLHLVEGVFRLTVPINVLSE